jgi:hypothetical protein
MPAFAALAGVLFFIGAFFYDADSRLVEEIVAPK